MSLRPPRDLSLRAKRSNLQGAIAVNGGDCFVAPLLAMTSSERFLFIVSWFCENTPPLGFVGEHPEPRPELAEW